MAHCLQAVWLKPVLSQAVAPGEKMLHQQPVQQACRMIGAQDQPPAQLTFQHSVGVQNRKVLEIEAEEKEGHLKDFGMSRSSIKNSPQCNVIDNTLRDKSWGHTSLIAEGTRRW